MKKISFVIPCYRSALTVEGVVNEITATMETIKDKYTYELILVNDCSPDNTFGVIQNLAQKRKDVTAINLAKNFGQHAALMAGFHFVKGDITVCLDDDGQTPADEVGKLLEKIEEGYDAVYARYEHKKHSFFRNIGSYLNEVMAHFLLGKPKELYVSSYFAVRRFVIDEMLRYQNPYPYVIGLVLRATKSIANVNVKHRQREIGTSGYNFSKLIALWLNGFTAFSVKPLRIATAVGGTCSIIGFIYGIYTIVKRFVNPNVPVGWSSTMAALMFVGGMMMLMQGLVGEYIGRIYISMNSAPQFVIREVVGHEEN